MSLTTTRWRRSPRGRRSWWMGQQSGWLLLASVGMLREVCHPGDAVSSVRPMEDASAHSTLACSGDPLRDPLMSTGTGSPLYVFTAEQRERPRRLLSTRSPKDALLGLTGRA